MLSCDQISGERPVNSWNEYTRKKTKKKNTNVHDALARFNGERESESKLLATNEEKKKSNRNDILYHRESPYDRRESRRATNWRPTRNGNRCKTSVPHTLACGSQRGENTTESPILSLL